MLPNFLIPETIVREAGKGPEIPVSPNSKTLLVTLGINRIMEQESLDIAIEGSSDGTTWKPLVRFPQKFYCGTYTVVLDLSKQSDVQVIRADYKVNRWGRGDTRPLFGLYVFAEDTTNAALTTRAVA